MERQEIKYEHTMIVTTAGRVSEHLDTVADEWGTVRMFTEDIAASELDFEPWIEGKSVFRRTYS